MIVMIPMTTVSIISVVSPQLTMLIPITTGMERAPVSLCVLPQGTHQTILTAITAMQMRIPVQPTVAASIGVTEASITTAAAQTQRAQPYTITAAHHTSLQQITELAVVKTIMQTVGQTTRLCMPQPLSAVVRLAACVQI